MWVIFEGLDKTGKGTLEREFLKTTNYRHIVIDRGPVGYAAFDIIFDRSHIERTYLFSKQADLVNNSKDFIVVYCRADFDIVAKRLKEHNEDCPYDYEGAQLVYEIYLSTFYDKEKVLMLDTGIHSIDECVELIRKKVEELENEHY